MKRHVKPTESWHSYCPNTTVSELHLFSLPRLSFPLQQRKSQGGMDGRRRVCIMQILRQYVMWVGVDVKTTQEGRGVAWSDGQCRRRQPRGTGRCRPIAVNHRWRARRRSMRGQQRHSWPAIKSQNCCCCRRSPLALAIVRTDLPMRLIIMLELSPRDVAWSRTAGGASAWRLRCRHHQFSSSPHHSSRSPDNTFIYVARTTAT